MSGFVSGRALALALLMIAPLMAGCMSGSPSGVVAQWHEERTAHGAVGTPATFSADLAGGTATLTGAGLASLRSPAALDAEPRFPRDPAYLFFSAVVEGHGTGILVFQGDDLILDSGTISRAPVAIVEVANRVKIGLDRTFDVDRGQATFPDDMENQRRAFDMSTGSSIVGEGLIVNGSSSIVLVTDGSAQAIPARIPFRASAMFWAPESRIVTDATTLEMDRFAFAGNGMTGQLESAKLGTTPMPAGLFGREATIEAKRGSISAKESFALIQARDADGWTLGAKVELHPHGRQVEVRAGESVWHEVDYREAGYVGAAILEDIAVTGEGAAMVGVPVDKPPYHIERLWSELEEFPWFAQPFAALAFALASPAVIFVDLVEALACVFATCPEQYPYPVWMEPGEIGSFYVKVEGVDTPGTYPATVAFTGANYETVSVDLEIEVV